MHFRDSPDALNGLGIPGNNWFHRFTVTYINMQLGGRGRDGEDWGKEWDWRDVKNVWYKLRTIPAL